MLGFMCVWLFVVGSYLFLIFGWSGERGVGLLSWSVVLSFCSCFIPLLYLSVSTYDSRYNDLHDRQATIVIVDVILCMFPICVVSSVCTPCW